jgi:hypothetical protein
MVSIWEERDCGLDGLQIPSTQMTSISNRLMKKIVSLMVCGSELIVSSGIRDWLFTTGKNSSSLRATQGFDPTNDVARCKVEVAYLILSQCFVSNIENPEVVC